MSIGRTSMLLTPLAAVARAVAFFVPVAIARWYGVQSATDAFYWALQVPTFVLVLGSMTTATVLVPVIADMRVAKPGSLPTFLGASLISASGVMSGLGALFAAASPWLLPRLTRFDAETCRLTTYYCWMLVPFLASVAANSVLKTACEVHGRFAAPAMGPLVRAAATLGTVYALLPFGVRTLPFGTCAGNFAETFWLLATLRRAGIHVVPAFAVPPELRSAARALGPVLIGEAMVALNVIIDKFFAGFMGRGSVTLLEYADRAQMIPKTLLESTLVVVAFNAWAVARAQGNDAERRRAVASTLWWILLLAPPVLAGMAIGRVALVRMLYEGGAFDPANTGMTADVLAGFTPGILFGLLGALIVKAHVVEQRFSLVMRLGFLSFAINAGLNVVLGGLLGLPGLALSTSLTTAVVTVVSFTYLAPDLSGTAGSAAVRDVAAVAGGSALLAIAAMIAGFAPARVTEGALWIASVPCFVLLGYGLRQVRRGLPA